LSDRRKPSAGGISGDVSFAAALAVLERASRDRFAEDWALYLGAMPRALRLRASLPDGRNGAGPTFGAAGGSGPRPSPVQRRRGLNTAHPLIRSLNLPIARAAQKQLLGIT
jgi:hypothetical protein